MSSWFSRTIGTFDLEEEEEDGDDEEIFNERDDGSQSDDDSSTLSPGRGMKEDLSELTKIVTRQFWGVASFLAPPPPGSSDSDSPRDPGGSDPIPGIRSDFSDIGGRFRSGISKLSDNMASSVSEITTKMASNFLQLGSDSYDLSAGGDAVGITEGVIALVRDIALHPETWLNFPDPDHEYDQDFDMSDAQKEHALAVERLVPRLAALRVELCPGYISEASFWKIYFILLHPRLDQHDAEILSTPQILVARAMLAHNIKNLRNANPEQDSSSTSYVKEATSSQERAYHSVSSASKLESAPVEISACEASTFPGAAVLETEKHPVTSSGTEIVDKSVIEEGNVNQKKYHKSGSASSSNSAEKNDEEDADDWLKEESSETVVSKRTTIPIESDEDVSFSDLEDDEGDVSELRKSKV